MAPAKASLPACRRPDGSKIPAYADEASASRSLWAINLNGRGVRGLQPVRCETCGKFHLRKTR